MSIVDDEVTPAASAVARPTATIRENDERIMFIDNARAIGIVLVVLGHAPSLPPSASEFIFAFHIPLFFLLSGLMVSNDRLRISTAKRAELLSKSLLLPYLIYFLISWLYWILLKRHGLRATEFESYRWWDPLLGFLRGNADGLYCNVVLWFFPCLFIVALGHHLISKVLSPWSVALSLAAICQTFVVYHETTTTRLLWSADCAIVGVAFYAVGAACNARLHHFQGTRAQGFLTFVIVFGYAACLGIAQLTGHVDLNHLDFGKYPSLYLPMSTMGIAATIALSVALPVSRLAHWLSINTLIIFPLHFLIFSIITGIAIIAFNIHNIKDGTVLVTLFYTSASLIIIWSILIVIRKLKGQLRMIHARFG